LSFITKPIQSKDVLDAGLQNLLELLKRPSRRVLVVSPDEAERKGIAQSIAGEDLEVSAHDSAGLSDRLVTEHVDCLIVDARSPADIASVAQAIEARQYPTRLPVLVLGDAQQEVERALQGCEAITLRHVHTRERLVDLAAFFLHRRVTRLPETQHRLLEDMHQSDAVLTGRKILVVDDDIRNIFALTSVLEEHGMTVVSAGNGRDALRIMATQSPIDLVLMDIMMPEMDGLATMREARKIPACRDLPIIAVTAKAMKGDRERCIEAGAWDYLSKPVDPHHMLAVMRSWLYQ
jgi:CheY-like chemotaxis protein